MTLPECLWNTIISECGCLSAYLNIAYKGNGARIVF